MKKAPEIFTLADVNKMEKLPEIPADATAVKYFFS